MKRWSVFLLTCLMAIGLFLAGCAKYSTQTGKSAGEGMPKIKVVASFYPMYDFAQQVGKEKVDVKVLVPAGIEPHDWEPTPQDMAALQEATVFVYNGAGFEHWTDKALQNIQNPRLITVETSQGIATIEAAEEHEHTDGEKDHGAEKTHRHPGEKDPHVWLDPVAAQHQVAMIRDAFIKADPANQGTYEANAAQYISKLAALDQEYKAALEKKQHTAFITSHTAFAYLAKRYGLEQVPILGLAPHAEPTPERLSSLVEEAREHRLKIIFFETLVSPKVAEIIAQEAGAKTLVLNPVEGLTQDDLAKGKDYIALMRENLANLKLALEAE